jgi:hypothetical protein
MFMSDTLVLDAPRRTADGYLAVRAKAARTGVYQYAGHEVDPDNKHGLRDQASVNVLRDDVDVFDKRSVHSFIGKPITNDHPTEAVTASNWKDHAGGVVMGAIRDGDHLAFDLLLTDASAIAAVDAGKVELSNGYTANLAFGDFAAADGTKCPVKQTSILGNHVALVDRGRAGSSCRIGDAALCDALPSNLFPTIHDQEKPVKTMLIDGLTVDMANADTAIATVQTLRDARDAANAKVTTLEAAVATKDATIATLTADKAALEAAKPTPAQLRDAAKQFAIVCDKAKALGITVTDSMDEAAIRKAVVDAKLGATAAAYTADQYAIAFDALTNGVKIEDARSTVHPINMPTFTADGASIRDTIRARRNAA